MDALVFIDGEIGVNTTLETVKDQLKLYPEADKISVRINSFGGDVAEGFAIYDFIRSQSKNKPVETINEGKCYSIATVVFLAGDKGRRLSEPNAEFMIHNPWIEAPKGDAKELKAMSQRLQAIEYKIENFYRKNLNLNKSEISDLMEKDTFLQFNDAKRIGLVDGKAQPLQAVAKYVQMNDKSKANQLFQELSKMLGITSAPKNMVELTKANGTVIVIDSEDEELTGKPVYVVTESGEEPAPDGEHELNDGRVLVVSEGLVTEIKTEAEPEPAAEDDELKKEFEEMKQRLENKESEISELKAKLEDQAKASEEAATKSKEEFIQIKAKFEQLESLFGSDFKPKGKSSNINEPTKKHKFDNFINL